MEYELSDLELRSGVHTLNIKPLSVYSYNRDKFIIHSMYKRCDVTGQN